jgi:hypothetical protein
MAPSFRRFAVFFLLSATAVSARDWSSWLASSNADVQWRWLNGGRSCYVQLVDKGTDTPSRIEAIATFRDDEGAKVTASTAQLPGGAYDEDTTASWQIGNCAEVVSVTNVKVVRRQKSF